MVTSLMKNQVPTKVTITDAKLNIYIYITEICLCVFEGERRLLSTAVKILKFVNKLSTRWGKLT